tara:strand:- start:775 stop:1731 length:957 start_codon:yes stop_codon:yes gene_type:complete
MKILITGCLGFIGFSYIKKFSNSQNIVGIDFYKKSEKNKLERLDYLKKNKIKCKIYNLNLENKYNFKKIKERNFDLIIHLAAKPGVFESEANPDIYVKKNLLMLTNVLQFTKNKKVKFFYFASSSSVYGGKNFNENNASVDPTSIYGLTKKLGEELINYFAHTYKIKCICLRFFTVYGPFGRPDMSYFKFLDLLNNKKPIQVYNNGKNKRPFTYVDDLVNIIYKLSKKNIRIKIFKTKNFDILNIGADKYYSVNDMLSILQKLDTKINFKIKYLKLLTVDPVKTEAKCKKLFKFIGPYKFINLHDGLSKFYDWYKTRN